MELEIVSEMRLLEIRSPFRILLGDKPLDRDGGVEESVPERIAQ